jgi:hypothetical protein
MLEFLASWHKAPERENKLTVIPTSTPPITGVPVWMGVVPVTTGTAIITGSVKPGTGSNNDHGSVDRVRAQRECGA